MNERIKELAEQAQKSAAFLHNSEQSKQKVIQRKFAELIVRECADYIACGEFGDAGLSKELKKYLGVE